MRNVILFTIGVIFLTGCASLNPSDSYYAAQSARVAAQARLAEQPLVTITCDSGCSASVRDPRAIAEVAEVKQGVGAAHVARDGFIAASDILKFGLGAAAAVRVADKIGDRNYSVNGDGNTFQQDYNNADISNTEITGQVSGDSDASTTTTTTTDNSVTNSNNPTDNTDNTDNSWVDNTNNQDNSVFNPVDPVAVPDDAISE